jgi:hypothetical protein
MTAKAKFEIVLRSPTLRVGCRISNPQCDETVRMLKGNFKFSAYLNLEPIESVSLVYSL